MCPQTFRELVGRIVDSGVEEDVLRAMRSRERRYVCYYLLDHERVALDELADVLAGWIAATDHRVTTRPDRDSLRLALYHNHLPRLAEAGLVAFDREELVTERTPRFGEVRALVAAAHRFEH